MSADDKYVTTHTTLPSLFAFFLSNSLLGLHQKSNSSELCFSPPPPCQVERDRGERKRETRYRHCSSHSIRLCLPARPTGGRRRRRSLRWCQLAPRPENDSRPNEMGLPHSHSTAAAATPHSMPPHCKGILWRERSTVTLLRD